MLLDLNLNGTSFGEGMQGELTGTAAQATYFPVAQRERVHRSLARGVCLLKNTSVERYVVNSGVNSCLNDVTS